MILAILIIIATLLGVYYLQTFNANKSPASEEGSGVIDDTITDYDDYFNNTVPLIFFRRDYFSHYIFN